MTPDQSAYFRDWTRLTYFLRNEDPEAVFAGLCQLVRWSSCQRGTAAAKHDGLFEGAVRKNTGLFLGLLAHLSTIDPHFYDLLKRMCARSLRTGKASHFTQLISSGLIVSEPPKTANPTLARNVAIILAVAAGQDLGLRPTEAESKEVPTGRSACGKLANNTGLTYSAVVKVWTARSQHLSAAHFQSSDIIDFLSMLDV